ncbi:MAG: ABC transporter ATP-binding protein, partial [Gammaproteobacteria bacterium]|nr:ABC transporter ATP-binding protein [Gammaproteobacteria bacterium]
MHFDTNLWQFTRGVRGRIAFTVLVGLAATLVGIVRLGLLGWLIGKLLTGASASELLLPALAVAVTMLLRGFLEHWRTTIAHETAGRVQLKLRLALYDQLLRLGPSYLTLERTGEVMLSLVEGVEQLEIYFGRYLPQVFVAALSPLLVFLATVWLDLPVALTLLVFAIITLLAPSLFHVWDTRNSQRRRLAYAGFASEFLDALQGLTTLKAFGQSGARGDQLAIRAREVFRRTMWVLATNAAARGITDTGLAIGAAAALALGAWRVQHDQMSLQALLIILMMGIEVFRPQRDLRALLHHGMLGQSAAQGILAVLQARPLVEPGSLDPDRTLPASVSFEQVTFTYPGGHRPAHDGLSFDIAPGERIGFVGASGSGKTTLLKLLLRLFDPESGCVRVGGHDLRELSNQAIAAQFAVVSQDAFLFHGTVRENLLLARADASDAQIIEAARAAHAHEFIERLPQGYDTVIGERGVRLSGGQRQRLAIARALLKDAPILVLDEALSAVDAQNEALILRALETVMRDRTTLVIAHRLSSVRRCDRIHVLEQGRLVESGNHDSLMKRHGRYAELMEAQARESRDVFDVGSGDEEPHVEQPKVPISAGSARPADNEILSAFSDLGWAGVFSTLLRYVQPWRGRLAAVLGLGVSRVLALIGVGILSALAVAAVKRGEPYADYLLVLVIVAPAAGVLHWLESWLAHDMAFRMLAEMRVALFRKLDSLAPAFLLRRRTGDLVAMATHDVELIEYFFAHTVAPAFVAVLVPGIALFTLGWYGWPMALALLPFLGWVALSPFMRRSKVDELGSRSREVLAELNATAVDTLQGLAEIHAFAAGPQRRAALKARNKHYLTTRLPFYAELSKQDAMLETATGLGGLAVVMSGSVLVTQGQLDPVWLPMLTLLALSAFLPVSEIAQVSRQLAETLGATRRMEQVNRADPAVKDGAYPKPLDEATASDAIVLDKVRFTYPGQDELRPALVDVSFSVPRGKTVALVGPSGAGKSTVAHLCMRFFDPDSGSIAIAGMDLRDWQLDPLRGQISLVTQDTYLFNDTLRANVMLARPDASENDLQHALERAALGELVSSLPDGVETQVGERGMRLSGGQRQR